MSQNVQEKQSEGISKPNTEQRGHNLDINKLVEGNATNRNNRGSGKTPGQSKKTPRKK